MKHVIIAGGTGLVGRSLAASLNKEGYHIGILTRGKTMVDQFYNYYHWDPAKGTIDEEVIHQADHVINLAGANLGAKRWTKSYKDLIYRSRVDSTKLLTDKINGAPHSPESFISASAINYYGIQRKGILDEASSPGSHFLSNLCIDWEKAAEEVDQNRTRLVIPRLATVLAAEEGAFPQMKAPVKWGAGAPLGPGNQYTPWIHIKDLVEILKFAITNDAMEGAYNAATPSYATNEELMHMIAKKLHKPFILPNVPSIALKLMIGEFADVLMTDLQLDVSRLQEAGYTFQFPDAETAINDLL